MAILAAVIERSNTGKGQYLDISMSDAALALNTMFGANALVSNKDPDYGTEMLNGGLFYDYYKTADGRYLSIGSLEPNFAIPLMRHLKLDDLIPKLVDQGIDTQKTVKQALAEKIAEKDFRFWCEDFSHLDLCVEGVLTINEAVKHPHFLERNMLCYSIDEDGHKIPQINSALPFKSESTYSSGRKLGADTYEVLKSLSYTSEDIDALISSACILQNK